MDDEAIFQQAIEISSSEERAAFIAINCPTDSEQARRLGRLLQAHFHADPFFTQLPTELAVSVAEELAENFLGSTVGPYRLLKRIGEGGMGVVYQALQLKPVERRVALKVIKPGMDSAKVIARLEAERQTLARMEHPHIARMIDAGTTDSGLPYFVMELVDGLAITDFCNANLLTIRQRLELFVTLCQAVQHAHQKGIIHRDLKPGNILVEQDSGAVKVIDFGVAKAIAQESADTKTTTEFTQTIGTPMYMSPEQADFGNQDIDTRSDVYSLGVILFELLTGARLFDHNVQPMMRGQTVHEVIQHSIAPRPSAFVAMLGANTLRTTAANCQSDPKQLGRQLRGELDWIVLKCLEKDRRRRYASVSALAEDIQRFLSNVPVLASPPSKVYSLRKFISRNRAAVSASVVMIASILFASGISWWKYIDERAARREVEHQRNLVIDSQSQLKRHLYTTDMTVAMKEADTGHVSTINARLKRHLPASNDADLRNFPWYFLNNWQGYTQQMKQKQLVLRGATSDVYFVAESLDGSVIAAASRDHSVYLWNAVTGKLLHTLSGHSDEVNTLAISPDGLTVVSGSDDHTVRLWSIQTGQLVDKLDSFQLPVARVQFSPDGQWLAISQYQPGSAITALWNVASRSEAFRQVNQFALRFTPSSDALATTSIDGIISIIDLSTQEKRMTTVPRIDQISNGVFTHDGQTLYACGDGAVVIGWDAVTGREISRFYCQDTRPRSLAITPDDRTLAVGGNEGIVRLFDAATGRLVASIEIPQQSVWSVAYGHDGHSLLAGCSDGNVYRWELPQSSTAASFCHCDQPVIQVAISRDTRVLAAIEGSNKVKIREVTPAGGLRLVRMLEFPAEAKLCFVSFIENDQKLLVIDSTAVVQLVDISSGEVTVRWQIPIARVQCAAIASDQSQIAVGSSKDVNVYDTKSHQLFQQFTMPDEIHSCAFSPTEKVVVVTHGTGLDSYNLTTNALQPISRRPPVVGQKCVFSPDGKLFATGCIDRAIRVWDAASGQEIATLLGSSSAITAIAFSPDSRILVSGSAAGELKLWNLDTMQEFFELRGHRGGVNSIVFADAGQLMVTTGTGPKEQGEIWLWSAPRPK